MSTSGAYGGSGWTCGACGTFVPYGCSHQCYTTSHQPPARTDHGYQYTAALQRIAAALERLVEVLVGLETPKR